MSLYFANVCGCDSAIRASFRGNWQSDAAAHAVIDQDGYPSNVYIVAPDWKF